MNNIEQVVLNINTCPSKCHVRCMIVTSWVLICHLYVVWIET